MPATAGTGAKPLFVNDMQLLAEDTIKAEQALTHADSLALMTLSDTLKLKKKRDWATWHPNPKRALWLAIVIPGAGQIYNRKYWKLPIVYGGFVGCAYAMRWNNQMYRDYSQAYLDLMDNDPNTQSYNQFLHLGQRSTRQTSHAIRRSSRTVRTSFADGATSASSAWWASTPSLWLTLMWMPRSLSLTFPTTSA